jgi:hypothetical protein
MPFRPHCSLALVVREKVRMRVLFVRTSSVLQRTKNPRPDPLPEYMEREKRAIAAIERYIRGGII